MGLYLYAYTMYIDMNIYTVGVGKGTTCVQIQLVCNDQSGEFKDLQGGHGRAAGGAVELRKWIRQGKHLSMRLRMQNEAVPKGRINFRRWMTTWMHLEIFLF